MVVQPVINHRFINLVGSQRIRQNPQEDRKRNTNGD